MGGGVSTQAQAKSGYNGNLAGAILRDREQFAGKLSNGETHALMGMVGGALEALAADEPGPFLSREEMKAEFVSMDEIKGSEATEEDWVGEFVDCFSPNYDTPERQPWDNNLQSRRWVDLVDGELRISGDYGTGTTWGRRFEPEKVDNPVLVGTGARRETNFISQMPADAPPRADAENGALEFIVTLGQIRGAKCLRWSTLYKGAGGKFAAITAPPDDGENYWVCIGAAAAA